MDCIEINIKLFEIWTKIYHFLYRENVPTKGGHSTTKVIKETTYSTDYGTNGKNVQRELLFDSPESNHHSRPRQRSPDQQKYYKTIERTTTTSRDGSYPDTGLYGGINRSSTRTLDRTVSPSSQPISNTNTTKMYNYSSTSKTEDVPANVPYNEIVRVETTQGGLPPELQDLSTLSEDILPKPSTKVTTTVRTYTYEIPAEPAQTTNKTIVYKNEYDNRTTNVVPPHQVISHSPPTNETYVYKNESHTTNTIDYPGGQPNYPRPTSPVVHHHPGQPPVTNKTIIYKTDTRETTRNVYPKNQDYPIVEYPPDTLPRHPQSPPPSNTTIIYKENITDNTNVHNHPPPGGVSVYPPPAGSSPPQPGPKTTYYYKHESTNTKNTHYGPPGSASPYPNDKYPKNQNPIIQYPSEPPSSPNWSSPPHNTTIKYTTNTTSSTRNVYPPEKEPLLQPTPFPTDGYHDYPDGQNPPKRLDDLMATFGDVSLEIFYSSNKILILLYFHK